jgi:hypothetical protein
MVRKDARRGLLQSRAMIEKMIPRLLSSSSSYWTMGPSSDPAIHQRFASSDALNGNEACGASTNCFIISLIRACIFQIQLPQPLTPQAVVPSFVSCHHQYDADGRRISFNEL